MIISLSNPKVTLAKNLIQNKKARVREGCFAAEGVRLIEEALRYTVSPVYLLYSPNLSERGKAIIVACQEQNTPIFAVSTDIMHEISDTETSQGIMGIFPHQTHVFPESPSFLLLVDGVRDPGNLGTLLRSAWASGVEGVITTEGTVDLFSPKVVRAGMGAHFALPLMNSRWEDIMRQFPKGQDLRYIVTVVDHGMNIWNCNFIDPCIIVVGGEADGVSSKGLSVADVHVTIPMAAPTESLNAGIAGSLVLFEVLRQRTEIL